MKKGIALIVCIVMIFSMTLVSFAEVNLSSAEIDYCDTSITSVYYSNSTLPFSDVNENAWYYDYVAFVYSKGLFSGTSDNNFSPDAKMNRAMMSTILYRVEGSPTVRKNGVFSDIPSNAYYADAVTWCYNNNIVNGVSESLFDPKAEISREQMVSILYRYAQYKGYDVSQVGNLDTFSDVNRISNYAKAAMEWAIGEELLSGYSSGELMPKNKTTRSQMAVVLTRFFEDKLPENNSIDGYYTDNENDSDNNSEDPEVDESDNTEDDESENEADDDKNDNSKDNLNDNEDDENKDEAGDDKNDNSKNNLNDNEEDEADDDKNDNSKDNLNDNEDDENINHEEDENDIDSDNDSKNNTDNDDWKNNKTENDGDEENEPVPIFENLPCLDFNESSSDTLTISELVKVTLYADNYYNALGSEVWIISKSGIGLLLTDDFYNGISFYINPGAYEVQFIGDYDYSMEDGYSIDENGNISYIRPVYTDKMVFDHDGVYTARADWD